MAATIHTYNYLHQATLGLAQVLAAHKQTAYAKAKTQRAKVREIVANADLSDLDRIAHLLCAGGLFLDYYDGTPP